MMVAWTNIEVCKVNTFELSDICYHL